MSILLLPGVVSQSEPVEIGLDKTGLVGWWDNSAASGTVSTILDQHTTGHNLATAGSPQGGRTAGTHPSGIVSESVDFVPVDYARSTDSAFNITSGGLTLGAWVYFDTLANNRGILARYKGSGNNRQYALYATGVGEVGLALSATGVYEAANVLASGVEISTNTWHYVVARWEPGIKVELFVDGVSIASDTTSILSSLHSASTDFWMGTEFDPTTANSMDGLIASAFIFSRALSNAEILQIYNGGAGVKYQDV